MNSKLLWYEAIFDKVKMRDVLTMYVQRTDKNKGRVKCPFHNGRDNNLSYNEEQFQCWVCGERGNVISFVAKLFNISNAEAARKIDSDFALGVFGKKPSLLTRRKAERKVAERKKAQEELELLNAKYDLNCSFRRYYQWFVMNSTNEHIVNRAKNLIIITDNRLNHILEEINARTN